MRMAGADLSNVIGSIPYRVALAGGWIDQPFVSAIDPAPPGSMVVACLEPETYFMERCGMASGGDFLLHNPKSSGIAENRYMAISHYLKEIGRGKDGARSLDRAQAADLFGELLDGQVSELELGAFCLAMRIKGETPEEMAGFLDATALRTDKVPTQGRTS